MLTTLKESKEKEKISTVLRLLLCYNFFIAPVKDGLAPLVSVYLVAEKGWDAGSAGIIWFARDVSTLVCQMFVGAFVDSFERKRLLLMLATAATSVAATSMVFNQSFAFLLVKSIIEGVATCFITPCKNGVALGLIGSETFDEVSKVNEMADHAGSFVFIIVAGAVSFLLYPNVVGVFYIIGGAGFIAVLSLAIMPLSVSEEDDHSASASIQDDSEQNIPASSVRPQLGRRQRSLIDQKSSRNLGVGEEVKPYSSILQDRNIALFAFSVFFFHLGNAAVLPLLSQTLAIDGGRAGLPYTCGNIAIAQVTSIFATWGMGKALKRGIPYKIPLIFGYAFAVPVRCFAIVLLLKFWPNNYALLTMQLFDGIGAGTYGLSLASLTRALTVGTGRFSFTQGLIITVNMCGGALSNLIGGYIVNLSSYTLAFVVLGLVGVASVLIASFIQVRSNVLPVTYEVEVEMEIEDEDAKAKNDQGGHVGMDEVEVGEDAPRDKSQSLSV